MKAQRWIGAGALLLPALASAAPPPWPADPAYVPWHCGGIVMTDVEGDDPPSFLGDLDIVGDVTNAAGLRAADPDFLYLRIRVDADPMSGSDLDPMVWGVEFDTDDDVSSYELLIALDATGGGSGAPPVVNVLTHAPGTPYDPDDPAHEPPAFSYAFADAARIVPAGTMTGPDPDYFIDLAVPWTDLATVGLEPATRVHVWVASSDDPQGLDGDFACWNESSSGAATLDGIDSGDTTPDPADDTGSGGGGGGGAVRLQGGGGCGGTCSSSGGGTSVLVALALLVCLSGRSRRTRRRRDN